VPSPPRVAGRRTPGKLAEREKTWLVIVVMIMIGLRRRRGAAVFASAGCAGCHTLEKAAASGTIGPALGKSDLTVDENAQTVKSGREANGMPSFAGQLTAEQIREVAEYVGAR
jgi:mono/diheme cytochrome c family protein